MYKTGFVMKVLMAVFVLAVFLNPVIASEKPAPEGFNQGPEIFVQLGHNFCGKV